MKHWKKGKKLKKFRELKRKKARDDDNYLKFKQ
jgi:hypothetical protein